MTTAQDIAEYYEFSPNGDGFTGECPSCSYRGFTLTEKDGRTLFFCHGGGCTPVEIMDVLREAGLWGTPVSENLFECLDDEPVKPVPKLDQDPPADSPALEMWKRSRPAAGTIVEVYLRARGYQGDIPPTLRYVTGQHPSDGAMHPIMVAAAYRPDNPSRLIGVHRTFLLADGTGKASLDPNKMSLGPIRGAGVPLAIPKSKIAVSEGIETGLSFMQATAIPTWAALSAGGIKSLTLSPDAREVLIAADSDPVGLEAARTAAQRWHGEGRLVRIVRPPNGLDFNDLARAS